MKHSVFLKFEKDFYDLACNVIHFPEKFAENEEVSGKFQLIFGLYVAQYHPVPVKTVGSLAKFQCAVLQKSKRHIRKRNKKSYDGSTSIYASGKNKNSSFQRQNQGLGSIQERFPVANSSLHNRGHN